MPMHTAVETHIETDQQNALRTELNGEIERLKPGISAAMTRSRSEKARLLHQQISAMSDINLRQSIGETSPRILRNLQSAERLEPALPFPPCAVTGVDDVCAGDELP